MKGYVAIQHKLLTIIYSLWKTDQAYNPDYKSDEQKTVAPTHGATLYQPVMIVLGT